MEVELRKSEVPALAELKDLCRHECTVERCADAVREFGWSLEHVPEDMKTPEMCRRALAASAELGYGHLALLHHIPFAEVCMEAIRDWYGEGRADSGGGGRQVPVLTARPPANAGAGGKGGGGVGGVRPPFRPGEAGIENAGAVAEMRRT